MQLALESLGSAQNVTLTHLARTKKIVFVEGMNDYKTIRRFAKNLGFYDLSSGNDLTAFESGGFSSWEKIKSFAWGVKNTIEANMKLFAIYDRDYYCDEELKEISLQLKDELTNAHIHERKEMENYLLNVQTLERVLDSQIDIRNKRSGSNVKKVKGIDQYLDEITTMEKSSIQAQYIARRLDYHRGFGIDASTISHEAIDTFEKLWSNLSSRMNIVPGKTTLRSLRDKVQKDYGVNLTNIQIIDEFKDSEIPADLKQLVRELDEFRKSEA
jgi:phage-related protein